MRGSESEWSDKIRRKLVERVRERGSEEREMRVKQKGKKKIYERDEK